MRLGGPDRASGAGWNLEAVVNHGIQDEIPIVSRRGAASARRKSNVVDLPHAPPLRRAIVSSGWGSVPRARGASRMTSWIEPVFLRIFFLARPNEPHLRATRLFDRGVPTNARSLLSIPRRLAQIAGFLLSRSRCAWRGSAGKRSPQSIGRRRPFSNISSGPAWQLRALVQAIQIDGDYTLGPYRESG